MVHFLISARHLTQGPCCLGSDQRFAGHAATPLTPLAFVFSSLEDRRQSRSTPEWLFCILLTQGRRQSRGTLEWLFVFSSPRRSQAEQQHPAVAVTASCPREGGYVETIFKFLRRAMRERGLPIDRAKAGT